jgi:hypothetical protein
VAKLVEYLRAATSEVFVKLEAHGYVYAPWGRSMRRSRDSSDP